MEVDPHAKAFGQSITAAIDAAETQGSIAFAPLQPEPFSADAYVKAVMRNRPVLFDTFDHANRGNSLSLAGLVHDPVHDAARVSVKWPQKDLQHSVCSMKVNYD
jgi:hypothetical protein